jgi:hypothetical protein
VPATAAEWDSRSLFVAVHVPLRRIYKPLQNRFLAAPGCRSSASCITPASGANGKSVYLETITRLLGDSFAVG